jgi:hypothetical protein
MATEEVIEGSKRKIKGSLNLLSKARYEQIKELLEESSIVDKDKVEIFLKKMCEIFKFSEEGKTYTEYHKEYYKEHKAELNKKRTEARRKKKLFNV